MNWCLLPISYLITLCAKVTHEVRKIRRSKICPFLYSNGHTEAKKIPENFFPWYHLACFFKMKIFKKFFLAKTHQEGPKIGYSQKNFFCKMTRKKLFQKDLEKIHSFFSMQNFSKFFSGHFSKKIFLAVTNFWTF